MKMQQDDKDRKNEIVIEGFEDKIKKLEHSLKEKDSLLRLAEGSLAEAHSQNEKLSKELEKSWTVLEKNTDRFNLESKALNARIEAEIEKNVKLSETVTNLWDKYFIFATQCIARLIGIFNSVRVVSEEVTPSTEYIPEALECIEKEVDVLDEVITGHGDFCALVASRGTLS
jgi:chromosome segregation ATPase